MSWFSRPDRIVQDSERHRLLVTMSGGEAFEGVLWECDDRSLVLKDAQAVSTDGTRIKADGDLLLPRSGVSYMQRID